MRASACADRLSQDVGCVDRCFSGGPGNELIGSHEHVCRLIACAARAAVVADDLQRDAVRLGSRLECGANGAVGVEVKKRQATAQLFENIAPGGQPMRREVVPRPRRERMRTQRAAGPSGRAAHYR